ncbi:hypothetical protein Pmani_013333 [Petrolisthes manimaculis]|uniref:Uncharacterized protein n=1 Tax=Petrolisthes manimaculis TaxID=1843537 RepID=A0AAE1PWM6_9EUCA|nr:hypothetical protein Pmani_013333 [Petrolisthes manimaculis]
MGGVKEAQGRVEKVRECLKKKKEEEEGSRNVTPVATDPIHATPSTSHATPSTRSRPKKRKLLLCSDDSSDETAVDEEHVVIKKSYLKDVLSDFKFRRNVGGRVEELRNDIWSTFMHCSSTDDNRQHHFCPKRKDSWCFYQRYIANNELPPSHKTKKLQFQLPSNLRQKTLDSRVYCSKYKKTNKNILAFAIAQSVMDYNIGYKEGNLLPELGSPLTEIRESVLKEQDRKREVKRNEKKCGKAKKSEKDYAADGL